MALRGCAVTGATCDAASPPAHHPITDANKIADALRAGPPFITKEATILDWPAIPGGDYRVLRAGTNEWTCLPGVPGYPHDEPGCFDKTFLQWIQVGIAGRESHIDRVGVSYMYVGAYVPNRQATTPGPEFHVGPHIMIVVPHEHQAALQPLSHDGSNGLPYVTHLQPQGTDLFLVLPFRQWNER
jgi:hypothetical protein